MEKPGKHAQFFVAGAVVIVVAAALFLVFGRGGTPGDASPEAGFARDMATHHAQAVDMSFTIRDKSQAREIRSLAFDIINTQANQRGMFIGWLQQWELDQATDRETMAWMSGHGHSGAAVRPGVMPGMATREDDFVEHFFVASTHAYLLCFTNQGQLYWLKVYNIPEASRTSPGRGVIIRRNSPASSFEACRAKTVLAACVS